MSWFACSALVLVLVSQARWELPCNGRQVQVHTLKGVQQIKQSSIFQANLRETIIFFNELKPSKQAVLPNKFVFKDLINSRSQMVMMI